MKKLISIILILSIVCSVFAISGINSAADSKYSDLLAQKKAYFEDMKEKGGGAYWAPMVFNNLDFIFYTKAAKEITLIKEIGETAIGWTTDVAWGGREFYVYSPEIRSVSDKCYSDLATQAVSSVREIIKHFGITKTEFLEAYKTMQEDPYAIRPLFGFLSDEEFETLDVGTINSKGTLSTPPEFIVEGLFMEDERKAYDLLTFYHSIYVPDLERVVTVLELEYRKFYGYDCISLDELLNHDLTTDSAGEFIKFLKNDYKTNDDSDFLLSDEEIALLESERQKQLANPKTGEAWYFIPVAAVSLVAGIFVICPRRKKFD